MTLAAEDRVPSRSRGLIAMAIFPPIRIRFAVALLLTFFPLGFLYPLVYPAGELLTLCCWIWVFPSPIGWLSLGLMPLIPSETYGYFAFNLFCLIANLSIAWSAFRSRELHFKDLDGLHKFASVCMIVTLIIAAVQVVSDPYIWISMFPDMRLESGRGAGLRLEPSQLSCLLALYLGLLAARMEYLRSTPKLIHEQSSLLWKGVWTILLTVAMTRSFSVLIIVFCFAPVLFIRKRHLILTLASILAGVAVGVSFLGDRINEVIETSGGSMAELITTSVGSWRNVPDILILSNYRDFLLPGNPSEVRTKINTFAILMSSALSWIQNTFSSFSAGGVTVGLLVTASVIVVGMAAGRKSLSFSPPTRNSWMMLHVAAWFFMAKWDPSAWVVLGLLPLMLRLTKQNLKTEYPTINKKLAGDGLPCQIAAIPYLHELAIQSPEVAAHAD
jgi:hypothetical protein